jgi:hypothetical protein
MHSLATLLFSLAFLFPTLTSGTPGHWLKHFTYDAWGRLIRTQVPWPWINEEPLGVSTRRFFYDGGRRIQERLTTPLPLDENGKPIKIKDEKDLTENYTLDFPSYVTREYVWDPDQTDRILATVNPAVGRVPLLESAGGVGSS